MSARAPERSASDLRRRAATIATLLCAIVALLLLGLPSLVWAAQLSRADAAMRQGMAWPSPRRSDSLPIATDPAQLALAWSALGTAIAARPAHPYAYRLRGQVALASGDAAAAARWFALALALAPRDRLVAWELALAYERLGDSERTGAAWRAAGLTERDFALRAAEALAAGDEAAARRWDDRTASYTAYLRANR